MSAIDPAPLIAHWRHGAWWSHVLGAGVACLPASAWVTLPFATVQIEGHAVMIVADSHGGKTTLIAELMARSQALVVDDNESVFDKRGRAVSLRRPMLIRPETADLLGQGAADMGRWFRFGQEDFLLQPKAQTGVFTRVLIDAVVLLNRRGSTGPRLEPIPRDVADRDAANCLRQRLGTLPSRRQMVRLGHVLRSAKMGAYRLSYTNAPDAAPLLQTFSGLV